jgi:hypothetical protein
MKVLDLCCAHQHRFEGWFQSDEDFAAQSARGLIVCPICEATEVTRLPSAPRLNLSGATAAPKPTTAAAASEQALAQWQAALMGALRQVVAQTEDVGGRFAEEARKIHYEEAPQRNIRGVASQDDVHALLDEGIEVVPLPLPSALKDTLQ